MKNISTKMEKNLITDDDNTVPPNLEASSILSSAEEVMVVDSDVLFKPTADIENFASSNCDNPEVLFKSTNGTSGENFASSNDTCPDTSVTPDDFVNLNAVKSSSKWFGDIDICKVKSIVSLTILSFISIIPMHHIQYTALVYDFTSRESIALHYITCMVGIIFALAIGSSNLCNKAALSIGCLFISISMLTSGILAAPMAMYIQSTFTGIGVGILGTVIPYCITKLAPSDIFDQLICLQRIAIFVGLAVMSKIYEYFAIDKDDFIAIEQVLSVIFLMYPVLFIWCKSLGFINPPTCDALFNIIFDMETLSKCALAFLLCGTMLGCLIAIKSILCLRVDQLPRTYYQENLFLLMVLLSMLISVFLLLKVSKKWLLSGSILTVTGAALIFEKVFKSKVMLYFIAFGVGHGIAIVPSVILMSLFSSEYAIVGCIMNNVCDLIVWILAASHMLNVTPNLATNLHIVQHQENIFGNSYIIVYILLFGFVGMQFLYKAPKSQSYVQSVTTAT